MPSNCSTAATTGRVGVPRRRGDHRDRQPAAFPRRRGDLRGTASSCRCRPGRGSTSAPSSPCSAARSAAAIRASSACRPTTAVVAAAEPGDALLVQRAALAATAAGRARAPGSCAAARTSGSRRAGRRGRSAARISSRWACSSVGLDLDEPLPPPAEPQQLRRAGAQPLPRGLGPLLVQPVRQQVARVARRRRHAVAVAPSGSPPRRGARTPRRRCRPRSRGTARPAAAQPHRVRRGPSACRAWCAALRRFAAPAFGVQVRPQRLDDPVAHEPVAAASASSATSSADRRVGQSATIAGPRP